MTEAPKHIYPGLPEFGIALFAFVKHACLSHVELFDRFEGIFEKGWGHRPQKETISRIKSVVFEYPDLEESVEWQALCTAQANMATLMGLKLVESE